MFVANDTNLSTGTFSDVYGFESEVFSKNFLNADALKGYKLIHDPESKDPENAISVSVFNGTAADTRTVGANGCVTDFTAFSLNLKDGWWNEINDYYHVIIPCVDQDGNKMYLYVMMQNEQEINGDNPFYELVDTVADAEPTSADLPSGGGSSDFSVATIKFINTGGDQTSYTVNLDYIVDPTQTNGIAQYASIDVGDDAQEVTILLYRGRYCVNKRFVTGTNGPIDATGGFVMDADTGEMYFTGNATLSIPGASSD